MSAKGTREVFVIADFKDRAGNSHAKGEVINVAYATDRQRGEVNEMVHRGFLTLEVAEARKHAEAEQRRIERAKRGNRA